MKLMWLWSFNRQLQPVCMAWRVGLMCYLMAGTFGLKDSLLFLFVMVQLLMKKLSIKEENCSGGLMSHIHVLRCGLS